MRPPLLLLLLGALTFAQPLRIVPTRYTLRSQVTDSLRQHGLVSNVVSEIRLQGDSLVWLGTGKGLSVLRDSVTIQTFKTTTNLTNNSLTQRLPEGGISAIAVSGNQLFVALATTRDDVPIGNGIVYATNSTDSVVTWLYYDQPTDVVGADTIPFGDIGFVAALPITVPQMNVTYDMAFSGGYSEIGTWVDVYYLWTASWAGGLRRYKLSDGSWERVPLPMDNQAELATCDAEAYETVGNQNVLKDFYLNPRDPQDGGNHNHKAFSILTYNDTIWVGTANGINRGIMGPRGCVNWEHYAYPQDGLSGNFVVGLALQRQGTQRIIWAATVNSDITGEQRGVSYTLNDGPTWYSTLLGERVYNITASISGEPVILAAAESGLWKSLDGDTWAKFKPAKQLVALNGDEILGDEVLAVALDKRHVYGTSDLIWIGTLDGLARSADLHGSAWTIYRANYDSLEVYAYPNPFSPLSHNVLNGEGYVRFHTGPVASFIVEIHVYNFAMEKVYFEKYNRQTATAGALKWDGRDFQGRLVDNGVYFINLKFSKTLAETPSNHWLKLIVVK